MNEIFAKLKKIISDKFGVPGETVTPESDLSGDFNLSSIEINDLLSFVRREFNLQTPADAEEEKVSTVQDLLNYIENYSENF